MSTSVRLATLGLVAVIAATSAASIQAGQPEGFNEFSAGEWFGNARAGGTTTASSSEGHVTGNGNFNVTMEFLVPLSGPTVGSWILQGSSVFEVSGGGGSMTIDWQRHDAEGAVMGDRQRLSLGTTQIRSSGTATIPGFGAAPVAANDRLGPIELRVAGRLCDDAWGGWIMSWNAILEGEGYSPTFNGNWHAVRQPAEFSQDQMREIASEVNRIIERIREFLGQAPVVNGVSVVPWDITHDLIERAVELVNELNNLSLCDQALLGDELQRYVSVLTHNIAALIGNLILLTKLEGYRMGGEDLLELATLAASVGAIGEGSVAANGEALERELEGQLEEVMTDPEADQDEIAAATTAAEQLGWEFPDGGTEP